jgi:hypothetical protein
MNVWKPDFSSTQLDFDEISNCHVNVQASTVPILQEFFTICFNRSSILPADDD